MRARLLPLTGDGHQLLLEALVHDVLDINLVEFFGGGIRHLGTRSLRAGDQSHLLLLVLEVALLQIAQELHQLLLLKLGLTFLVGLQPSGGGCLLGHTTLSLGFLDFVVLEAVRLLQFLRRVGHRLVLLQGLSLLQLREEGGLGVHWVVDLSWLLQLQRRLEGVLLRSMEVSVQLYLVRNGQTLGSVVHLLRSSGRRQVLLEHGSQHLLENGLLLVHLGAILKVRLK